MPMREATWRPCPGLSEGKYYHSMQDGCWSCAPFWEYFPACPHCGGKLMKRGRTKCQGCKRFVLVKPREETNG